MLAIPHAVIIRHVEDLIDRIEWKFVVIAQRQRRKQQHAAALTFRLAQESWPLLSSWQCKEIVSGVSRDAHFASPYDIIEADRNTDAGATAVALRAGMNPATSNTAINNTADPRNAGTSHAPTPNSIDASKWVDAEASGNPIAAPTTPSVATSRNTSIRVSRGPAPSAMRIPNSTARWLMPYDTTPNNPTAVSEPIPRCPGPRPIQPADLEPPSRIVNQVIHRRDARSGVTACIDLLQCQPGRICERRRVPIRADEERDFSPEIRPVRQVQIWLRRLADRIDGSVAHDSYATDFNLPLTSTIERPSGSTSAKNRRAIASLISSTAS